MSSASESDSDSEGVATTAMADCVSEVERPASRGPAYPHVYDVLSVAPMMVSSAPRPRGCANLSLTLVLPVWYDL